MLTLSVSGVKLVPLQKGVSGDMFECSVFRKFDVTVDGDDKVKKKSDVSVDTSENKESASHTLEELKQINHQLYKYSLKHILKTS